ncbi:ATP-binding protein [Streptomyces sp. TLI_171]|uniref:ATP-binding protein n=1 Tax=Streptomyces sp. TLI_171 TaxID=1938859 RepID=UPI000C64B2C6|nr:ATP-binding protein [Streptomyces sp. TLI_171]RKE21182.1 signal transduction histidine kinase [Streptomyces sp. TLI_171]
MVEIVLALLAGAALTAGPLLWSARRAVRTARAAGRRATDAENRADGAVQRALAAEENARAADGRARAAEARHTVAEARLAAAVREAAHLAHERLPAAATALTHPRTPVPGPLDPAAGAEDLHRALDAALGAAVRAVLAERERTDAAARAALRGAASKIQALLIQVRSLLEEIQLSVDDPRLLALDFRNELTLRRVQSLAVLSGAWPGMTREDSPLAELCVGAQSRVAGYARVEITNHLREPRLAVAARAAEPVAIALAEILGNATAYSHPETRVVVSIEQGSSGALVVVDDMGVGMEPDQLERAGDLLDGQAEVLLTELGDPPQAGFAVIGLLCRQFGFGCRVEPSPYGGVRAILRLPADLLTLTDPGARLSALAPRPITQTAPVFDAGDALPTRKRRAPRVPQQDAPSTLPAPAGSTPDRARSAWAALQSGTAAGRSAALDDPSPQGPAAPEGVETP